MKLSRLFLLTCKRYLSKPLFLLALLLLPLAGLLLSPRGGSESPDRIRVALSVTDGVPEADTLWLLDELLDGDRAFSFYLCDEEQLYDDVLTGAAECGYLLPAALYSLLLDGDADGAVRVVTTPQSALVSVTNEVFYAALFERLARERLVSELTVYGPSAKFYPERFTLEEIYETYEKYSTRAATMRISYEHLPERFVPDTESLLLSPMRGLFAVLILLCGFIGALSYYRAAEHPIYKKISVRIVSILVPLLFAGLVVLLSLYLFPDIPGVVRTPLGAATELLRLLGYQLLCLAFLLLTTSLLRSARVFCAVLPLYLLGSLFFSPIFIDAGRYLTPLRLLSRLFLPTWYL